jgi:hypothetical protein
MARLIDTDVGEGAQVLDADVALLRHDAHDVVGVLADPLGVRVARGLPSRPARGTR